MAFLLVILISFIFIIGFINIIGDLYMSYKLEKILEEIRNTRRNKVLPTDKPIIKVNQDLTTTVDNGKLVIGKGPEILDYEKQKKLKAEMIRKNNRKVLSIYNIKPKTREGRKDDDKKNKGLAKILTFKKRKV